MKITNRSETIKNINLNGRVLTLDGSSKIMGIINLTPDSFSDGGDFINPQNALSQAVQMESDGAHILDLGAESSRPGHFEISAEEEIQRLKEPLQLIIKNTKIPLSVDTWKSEVADFALKNGASIINDIYGLKKDISLAKTIASYDAGVIIMHNKSDREYTSGIMKSITDSLLESIDTALEAGISKDKIILDPGIGFAKDSEQNIKVLNNLFLLKELGFPLLLGVSRKSVIAAVSSAPPKERLGGTIASTVLGIIQGFEIFRVHDVKENLQAALFTDRILQEKGESIYG